MHLNKTDQLINGVNQMLNILFVAAKSKRVFPATTVDNNQLSDNEKTLSCRYIRVNHAGEICAQALYQSQSFTAQNNKIRQKLQQAASEENDHLAWCEQRINELGGNPSLLNPVWYAGAFVIGSIAGLAGDRWNFGFLAETEKQVADHLDSHLSKLPEKDQRSREIVLQMKIDEQKHEQQAIEAGSAQLPMPVKHAMRIVSRVMTYTAYWI